MTPVDARSLPETCYPATLWLWPGHAAYLGPSLRLDAHSGSVQCFALGVDAPFTLRTADTGERSVRSALISARTRHQLIAGDGRMLFYYLDPSSAFTNDVRDRMTEQTSAIAYTHQAESSLVRYLRDAKSPDPTHLQQQISGSPVQVDDRIRAAMLALQAQPALNLSAADLAAEANLSLSRFLHLFSATAGTSFRRYRLWTRMLHVALAVSKGLNLTTASTEAGFTSPSHFSDTFHNTFGLTANALLTTQTQIVIQDA